MKAIYTARGDGLGTRMLSALYARILAQHLGLPVKVIWSPLGGANIYADYVLMHPRFLLEIFADRSMFIDPDPDLCGEILTSEEAAHIRLRSLYHSQNKLSGLSRQELPVALDASEDLLYDFPGQRHRNRQQAHRPPDLHRSSRPPGRHSRCRQSRRPGASRQ